MRKVFAGLIGSILAVALLGGMVWANPSVVGAKNVKAPAKSVKSKPLTTPSTATMSVNQKVSPGSWHALGAFGGGAAALGVGYLHPYNDLDFIFDTAFYLGNQYSIFSAKIGADIRMNENYVGMSMGIVNFSQTVAGIPGVAGNVSSGANLDFGMFAGREIGLWRCQLGYGTVMGIIGELSYKF